MSDTADVITRQHLGGRKVEVYITPAMLEQLQRGEAVDLLRGADVVDFDDQLPTDDPETGNIESSTIHEIRLTVAKH
jgi:hypothetical protein